MDRLSLYARYAMRSLRRGGQRTFLGILCISVGVMAIVAMRLAGDMVQTSLTSNVRVINGGDVSLRGFAAPLSHDDLATLDSLVHRGIVSQYEALGIMATSLRNGGGRTVPASTYVIHDTAHHPLVGNADFVSPAQATFESALHNPRSIVVSEHLAGDLKASVGTQIHIAVINGRGSDFTVGGIIADHGSAFGGGAYISETSFLALSSVPEQYGMVNMLAPTDAAAQQTATELRHDFPQAIVRTVKDALDANKQASQQITQFLLIVGLLALFIGGVGILNTMRVMLWRRRTEIAVLKTFGYTKRDLYALFGMEALFLGIGGSIIGVGLGVGASAIVKTLMERVLNTHLAFSIQPAALLTGVAVGVSTSLIFGVLPIVRASGIRPLAVIRDLPVAASTSARAVTFGLYLLVALLFAGLSAIIIGNFSLALVIVAATGIFILALFGVFSLLVWGVSRLHVPERLGIRSIAINIAIVLALLWATAFLPTIRGITVILLVASLFGFVAVILPARYRIVLNLVFRSFRSQRARVSMTLVALFAGVANIGLILVLGHDISTAINTSINVLSEYNVFVVAAPHDVPHIQQALVAEHGIRKQQITQDVDTIAVRINDRPMNAVLPTESGSRDSQFRLFALSGIEGYSLSSNQLPTVDVSSGRKLTSADSGSLNTLAPDTLEQAPFSMHPGDTVTLKTNLTAQTSRLTVVGFYPAVKTTSEGVQILILYEPLLGDVSSVTHLAPDTHQTVFALSVEPATKGAVVHAIETAAPDATVQDTGDFSFLIQDVLGNVVNLLLSIALLALFAGMVMIANAVALTMLERRRDIGIFKAVGFTSHSVLAQVLIENGIIGLLGATIGMCVVTACAGILGVTVLHITLAVDAPLVIGVIVGTALLCSIVAGVVAYGPSRTRPVEVLRYE